MNTKIDAAWSFQRYEQVRSRFPTAVFPDQPIDVPDLRDLAVSFDAFVFDAFGVLNVGETPIPSAIQRVAWLRSLEKHVRVLTNAASLGRTAATDKFRSLGYDFLPDEIVSSRQVLIAEMKAQNLDGKWACIAPEGASFDDLPVAACAFDAGLGDDLSGVIFLGAAEWDFEKNRHLSAWLRKTGAPFLVGNPDLVAPRGDWFSVEPGAYANEIADQNAGNPEFFGKPFGNAFDAAYQSFGADIPRDRVLMVGDTLHTDILGGAAAGFKTCLVTGHGVLKDMDHMACIDESAIIPDYIVPSI